MRTIRSHWTSIIHWENPELHSILKIMLCANNRWMRDGKCNNPVTDAPMQQSWTAAQLRELGVEKNQRSRIAMTHRQQRGTKKTNSQMSFTAYQGECAVDPNFQSVERAVRACMCIDFDVFFLVVFGRWCMRCEWKETTIPFLLALDTHCRWWWFPSYYYAKSIFHKQFSANLFIQTTKNTTRKYENSKTHAIYTLYNAQIGRYSDCYMRSCCCWAAVVDDSFTHSYNHAQWERDDRSEREKQKSAAV